MSLSQLGYRPWHGRLGSSWRCIWPVARVALLMVGSVAEADDLAQKTLLRGLEKVRAEWALICTAHNLTKLARAA